MSREINENELENIGGGSEDAIISTDAFRGLGKKMRNGMFSQKIGGNQNG